MARLTIEPSIMPRITSKADARLMKRFLAKRTNATVTT
jgi:hypothetical protein